MRPSTEQKVTAVGDSVERVVFGLIVTAVGVALDYKEYQVPAASRSTMLLMIYAGFVFVGLLVVGGRFAFPVIQKIYIYAAPYIPRIGGGRAGDPPAPPSAPTP